LKNNKKSFKGCGGDNVQKNEYGCWLWGGGVTGKKGGTHKVMGDRKEGTSRGVGGGKGVYDRDSGKKRTTTAKSAGPFYTAEPFRKAHKGAGVTRG